MTRIEEIRARLASVPSGYAWLHEDVAWLAGEVARLSRVESAALRLVGPKPRFSESSAVRELRAALSGAEGCAECERLMRANAVLGREVDRLTRERDAADAQVRAWSAKLGEALGEVAKLVPVADAEAVAAATAAERERCARVCEERASGWADYALAGGAGGGRIAKAAAADCAAAIRRGGEK